MLRKHREQNQLHKVLNINLKSAIYQQMIVHHQHILNL